MKFPSLNQHLLPALTIPLIFACSSATDVSRRPVSLSVRAAAASSSTTGAALQVSSLRLLVNQASLGSGDQFGCQDCQGGPDGPEGNETGAVGAVVSVPLDGSPVNLATEQVQPGTYSQVEIELGGATVPGWTTGQTVEIKGTSNGTPFTVRVAVNGSFRETLSPPVVVTSTSAAAIPVVITLPVAAWFTAGGQALDPAIPAQLAQIEANIRSAFSGSETGLERGGE